jgi:hypothetical protein
MVNLLTFETQVQVVASLVDGCSILATERITSVRCDTIMRLALRVGEGCARIHNEMMRGLQIKPASTGAGRHLCWIHEALRMTPGPSIMVRSYWVYRRAGRCRPARWTTR